MKFLDLVAQTAIRQTSGESTNGPEIRKTSAESKADRKARALPKPGGSAVSNVSTVGQKRGRLTAGARSLVEGCHAR